MTGSIQEKKGYLYTVIYVKNSVGKSIPKWQSTGLTAKGNKRRAEQILRERITEYEQKSAILTKNITFVDFMRQWLEVIQSQVKESTFNQYKRIVENSIIPFFGPMNIALQNLEPIHIQQYYKSKVDEGLSGNTVKHHHANIHKALQYALKLNWIAYNPADRVELPKVKAFTGNFYNDEQIKELLNQIKGDVIETPVLLAATYGLRRSEALGLQWGAVDFERHTITIKHTVVPNRHGLICADTTKNKTSTRTLQMLPFIEEHLKRIRARQKQMQETLPYSYIKSDYVCTWNNGSLIQPDYLSRHFKSFLQRKGLPLIRFHDLRHSSASLLIANGCSLKEVGEWLGHSCITTTNRYAHLQYQATVNMANIVNERLFSNV